MSTNRTIADRVRAYRNELRTLDEEVKQYGAEAIYQGIRQEVDLEEDYRLAVEKLADSHQWDRQVLSGIRYTENVVPTRGRPRRARDETLRLRRRDAQRRLGVYFKLLKTVMTQLEEKNFQAHQIALEGIRNNCLHLHAKLLEINARRRF